jgi:hypothetical protein
VEPYWKDVVRVPKVLSYKVKLCNDDDDLELCSADDRAMERSEQTAPLIQALKAGRLADPGIATNVGWCLGEILREHALANPDTLRKKFRLMSIHVLTDGCWEAKCTGKTHIRNLIPRLLERGYPKEQLVIHFIHLRSDPSTETYV